MKYLTMFKGLNRKARRVKEALARRSRKYPNYKEIEKQQVEKRKRILRTETNQQKFKLERKYAKANNK